MVELAPRTKQDEQYPLLKVAGGGGDGNSPLHAPVTVVTSAWGVTGSKPSWLNRWPEYVSACWMTFILLGISFLVFYTLAMETYRRQPVLMMQYNASKPASNVYYHHIVQRENPAPLIIFSDYLANMAVQYPLLHFHVIFLIDDSLQTPFRGPRHNRFINKLIPYSYSISKLDENNMRELRDFRRKYQNVNVTVIPLSKYMATTPLKYKWRTIPLPYITFYARVFSVWQNGGIGMDLITFNNAHNNHQLSDRRISAILKQHNDGIKPEEYKSALMKIDCDKEIEFFSALYGLVHQVLNETRTFLCKNIAFQPINIDKESSQNEPLIRTHRNKRDISEITVNSNVQLDNNSNSFIEFINVTNETDFKRNEYLTVSSPEFNLTNLNTDNEFIKNGNDSNKETILGDLLNKTEGLHNTNKSEITKIVWLYDISVFADGLAPSYVLPNALMPSNLKPPVARNPELYKTIRHANRVSQLLSIDSEGIFVAASSRLHPFLGFLIPSGCQRMHPKFAIQDGFLTQCSGIFREESYCNNIYLL